MSEIAVLHFCHGIAGLILDLLWLLTQPSYVERILVSSSLQSRTYVVLERLFSSAPFSKRTHNCGALTPAHVGTRVVLAGWLLPER
jgi:hypothetical protein